MILGQKILLLLLIFILPLIEPNWGFGFEQTKVFTFIVFTTLIGLIWSLTKNLNFHLSKVKIASLIFIIILLISSIYGLDLKTSFLGRDPYYQGFLLYLFLFLFSLLVSASKISLWVWSAILTLSALLVSLIAVEDWIFLNLLHFELPTYAGRVISTFGQPNFYAGFLLMTLPLSYLLLNNSSKWVRITSLISIVVSTFAILISESRIAIIMLLALGIGWIFLKFLISNKVFSLLIILLLIILPTVFSFSTVYLKKLINSELCLPTSQQWLIDNSPEKRIYIWNVVGNLIIKRPILGYGLENLPAAFSFYDPGFPKPAFYFSLKDLLIDRSHNYFLDLLVFSGIGLLGYLLIIYFLIKKTTPILLISLLTYLIWVQFQNQSIVHLAYFWLLVGLADKRS